jgi:asparagine synthase (glutamine-hydrolysing)
MSGIVGLMNLDGAPVDGALLASLTQSMALRGPDAQATWAEGAIGLGHALLRTTFESAQEVQPCTLDGAVWITADARIDGRSELIAELRARGRAADSSPPDVELILHAYAAWETACVEHLIGDFAFAIWDARRRRLFCARDQIGTKPFFYCQQGQTLAFSNSLDCLRRLPGFSPQLDELAVADFLLFNSNQDPTTTIFADIRRLAPAHTLTCAGGALQIARYWRLPEHPVIEYRPEAETVAHFQNLFTQAVSDRLRTDRVGVPMSGGMDSSSVAVMAQRLMSEAGLLTGTDTGSERGVRAFTLIQDQSNPEDEGGYARLVAEQAHLTIEYLPPPAPPTPDLDHIPYTAPEPGPLGVEGPEPPLARALLGYSRVTLSGLGGDPLLYPSRTFVYDLLRGGDWIRLARLVRLELARTGKLPPLYLRAALKRRLRRGRPLTLPTWIDPAFAARLGLLERQRQVTARIEAHDPRRGLAESPFWSNLLAWGDPGYNGLPLEARHPFFDVRLLIFALSVPPIPWMVNKALLRAAMRGLLPEKIRLRPKTPLGALPASDGPPPPPVDWPSRLAATSELEPFVNMGMLMQNIEAAAKAAPQDLATVSAPLALAYWLRGQKARFGTLLASGIIPPY